MHGAVAGPEYVQMRNGNLSAHPVCSILDRLGGLHQRLPELTLLVSQITSCLSCSTWCTGRNQTTRDACRVGVSPLDRARKPTHLRNYLISALAYTSLTRQYSRISGDNAVGRYPQHRLAVP